MAEKIVSPGVFTKEIDASFLPAAIADIGAVIVGPTVKGPAMTPTVVESYSEYQQLFGDSFKSGSNYFQYLTSHTAEGYLKNADKLTVVRILGGSFSGATANVLTGSGNERTGSAVAGDNEVAANTSFKLHTLADGVIMNNKDFGSDPVGLRGILISGSSNNIRWEIVSSNTKKGTFSLSIRSGNDISKKTNIVESWRNLSLDPGSPNYISKRIGDSYLTLQGSGTSDPYLKSNGSNPSKSKYVYVSDVNDALDYLDVNGDVSINSDGTSISQSMPGLGSGSFGGSFSGGLDGTVATQPHSFYENSILTDTQGFNLTNAQDASTAYLDALNLLSNADQYDFNLLLLPGIIDGVHTRIATKAIDVCENRGDCFVILDPVMFDSSITDATARSGARNSNHAAMYWPWVQINDNQTGQMRWVPPSVVVAGMYSFNDKIAAPWFAPAGLNRGKLGTVIQTERNLTHANRDELYESNVNPIAVFPADGVVVWGQKTLQKKASALDRINVRRLLIKVKKFIASSSRYLLFEANNVATRKRFLNMANPFLEQIQSNSGLNAFRVVMDETNNTPDVVDRNILYGQIFVQPTKTSEFIVLDFTIQPTGATFPE